MNIIDSFYFLFKTNAKDAQKQVDDLDKSSAGLEDQLKKTGDQSDKTNLSFSKLALAGVAALESFATLGKLKDTIIASIDYQASLEKTAKLTNVNARELSLWNDVVSRAGGNPGGKEYLNFITQLNQKYAALGVNDRIKRVNQDLIGISAKFQELERNAPGSSQALAEKLGIGPDLWLALKDGPEVLQANIEKMKELDNTTDETAKAGLELKGTWSDVVVAAHSLGNAFQPLARALAWIVEQIIKILAFDQSALNRVVGGVYNYLTGSAPSAATTASTAAPVPSGNAPLGIRANNPGNLQPGGREAVFPTLQAGIGAEQDQIKKYGRRGINTIAGIAANWPDKAHAASWQSAVQRYTGYSANQPLDLNDPNVVARIAQGINFAEGDQAANAAFAAQSSISAADSAPQIPSSTTNSRSVTIGHVTVNTQATDARGIAQDLHGELSSTVQSYDDGVKF